VVLKEIMMIFVCGVFRQMLNTFAKIAAV